MTRRDKTCVINDFLEAVDNGFVRTTELMSHVGLSYTKLQEYWVITLKSRLVEKNEGKLRITEKGRAYISGYHFLEDLLK